MRSPTGRPVPGVAISRQWRAVVWGGAGVSLLAIIAPCLVGAIFVPELLGGLVISALVWLPYLYILLYLRSQKPKRALALGVAMPPAGLLVGTVVALVFAEEAFEPKEWLIPGAFGLFALVQLVLIVGSIKAYYSMPREDGDRRMLRRYLVLGAVYGFAAVFLLGIALPGMVRSRKPANESAAVGTLRTINTSAVVYEDTYKNGYPPNLKSLGPPAPGSTADCNQADFIAAVMVSGEKSRYRFEYEPGPRVEKAGEGCVVAGVKSYTVTARPLQYKKTGVRSFFTDETGVIRSAWEDRAARAADPPL